MWNTVSPDHSAGFPSMGEDIRFSAGIQNRPHVEAPLYPLFAICPEQRTGPMRVMKFWIFQYAKKATIQAIMEGI
jgi:hypothetical protein